ncbi:MAG TPA: hypothetical protein VNI54_05815 [Thermoanaerobaculia bacterium]|nr:hypothetical protein [Thermoanaerobaculia bacterium]
MRVAFCVALSLVFVCPLFADVVDDTYQQIHTRVCTELQAQTCPSVRDAEEKWAFVATWCDRHGTDALCSGLDALEPSKPIVIAFDHDAQSWRPIRGLAPMNLEANLKGEVTALTKSGKRVLAVVESTNPLLYTAAAGAITETDAAVVAELKAFLTKLAPAITGVLESPDGPLTFEQKIAELEAAIGKVRAVTEQWQLARKFAEDVEHRRHGKYTLMKLNDIDEALAEVKEASDALESVTACAPVVTAMLALFDTPPDDVAELEKKRKAVNMPLSCEQELRPLRDDADSAIRELREAAAADKPAKEQNWRDLATSAREQLAKHTKAQNLRAAATEMLGAKRAEIRGIFNDVRKFETRLMEFVVTTATKESKDPILTGDVADFFVAPRAAMTGGVGEKVRNRTLTVTKSSPFDKADTRRPDSVATAFGIGSLFTSQIDVGAALTHTPLDNPVFGVQSVDGKNVIVVKDEKSRSGKIGLFVSLPFFLYAAPHSNWSRNLAVDVGTNVSDEPALFLGLSWQPMRLIRLGAGGTMQQVKALDGQELGRTVTAATDIRQKNAREMSWYASFSLSFAGLDLFKK